MKLKSYFLTLLTAATLFSCSKEDNPGIELPDLTPDATLSLAVNATTKTKGEVAAVQAKDVISNLMVIVYIGDDFYTLKNVTLPKGETTLDKVEGIPVKSGNVKVLVLANVDTTAFKGKSLAEAREAVTVLSKEKHRNLTMSSNVMDVTLKVSTTNCLGYGSSLPADKYNCGSDPVKLYRTVAEVELSGLALKETTSFGTAQSFHLDSIFVANVKSKSGVVPASTTENWGGAVEANISENADWWYGKCGDIFGNYKEKEIGGSGGADKTFLFYENGSESAPSYYDESIYFGGSVADITVGRPLNPTPSTSYIGAFFYVYENASDKGKRTLLVVKGDYTYIPTGRREAITVKDRYYTMTVNENGIDAPDANFEGVKKHSLIKRNTRYKLSMTLAGPGSDNPYTPDAYAHISFQITVQDWNVIDIQSDVD